MRLVVVEVPKIENSEEYEYLPGHFDVRYITGEKLGEDGEALYTVRLESEEIQTVRPVTATLVVDTLKSPAHWTPTGFPDTTSAP